MEESATITTADASGAVCLADVVDVSALPASMVSEVVVRVVHRRQLEHPRSAPRDTS